MAARLAPIDLPEFGMPEAMPGIPDRVYSERVLRLRERMALEGWDRLVVFADREHSANLSYLTGFDPQKYHEFAIASNSAVTMTRMAALKKMVRPLLRLRSQIG